MSIVAIADPATMRPAWIMNDRRFINPACARLFFRIGPKFPETPRGLPPGTDQSSRQYPENRCASFKADNPDVFSDNEHYNSFRLVRLSQI
jgi:hypothetical protein